MYLCLDCDNIFEEPKFYIETHGLDSPPYETWWGCPKCAGAYTEAMHCDECGDWISGEYIELKNGFVICRKCYIIKSTSDYDY